MTLTVGTFLPSFDGATEWLNGEPTLNDFGSRPLLVRFWAVSCPVCAINAADVRQIISQYAETGIALISVHMPRMESDTIIDTVRQAASELQITEPCAIDNEHIIGSRFKTAALWPYYFLFDSDHKMRRHAAGPNGLRLIEKSLKRLIEAGKQSHDIGEGGRAGSEFHGTGL